MIILAAIKKDNIVYVGKNHAECFTQEPKGALRDAEQGFVTDDGDFLDRTQALEYAYSNHQISKELYLERKQSLNELFSEDLWERR